MRNCHNKKNVELYRYRHAGLKGERIYSSYSFLISAIDWVSGDGHAPAALSAGKEALVPIG
jgi:hypothetical protein